MAKQTPMYKQYKELKALYPDALLFYRLGDFYELFEDHAEIGARELGLTLTRRKFSKDQHLPMAGVPHRHVDGYINRLLNKGFMVAIADQLEDARKAKGLVKRGIVRVITSGTVMDQPMLKDFVNNYLMALIQNDDLCGLAFVDVSTGEFNCAVISRADLIEEIARICPSEAILPTALVEDTEFTRTLKTLGVARISPIEGYIDAQTLLKKHFNVSSLEAYSDEPLALDAAGIILHYLKANQLSDLAHITNLVTYHQTEYMALDSITRRNLELSETLREKQTQGTLLNILNQTKTRMGTRLLRRWLNQPLCRLDAIQARLDTVEIFVNNAFLRHDLRDLLHGMYDLERLAGRIGYGNANGRDLVNLKATLIRVPEIKHLISKTESSLLNQIQQRLDPLTAIAADIERSLVDEPPILLTDGGLIKSGFHAELDALRQTASASRDWLAAYEAAERERSGIKNLRIKYNQVFGFFIEITKSNLGNVPDDYQRRSSIANGERFTTPELKAHEAEILAAEDLAKTLEYDLFIDIRRQVANHLPILRQTASALAMLDVLLSLAELAALHNYAKPTLTEVPSLSLREARHPVVEQTLPGDAPFVANDCDLNPEQRLIMLTGPNMSGKSVYLRQTAMAVLMAHIGSFVATSEAEIGLTDRIFVRAGASDDISQGRSTFLVEMSETAHILHHATDRSLVILDEVGRGTSTYDGMSLAWAVAEDIHETLLARCLFATHFHEMTALAETLSEAANFSMAVHEKDGDVIFLRKLIPSGADKSYGIHVARLAGLPSRVLEKAEALLASLEARGQMQPNGNGTPVTYQPNPKPSAPVIAETQNPYHIAPMPVADDLILPADEPLVWEILRALYQLDIANLTPVEALMRLNEWQQQLKQGK